MLHGVEIAVGVLLILASLTDLYYGKIYNLLTIPFFVAGLIYQFIQGGTAPLLSGLLASVVAFAFLFPLYQFKAMAAGDVKLLMAVGAWTDSIFVLRLCVVALVVGGTVAGIVLFRTAGLKASFASLKSHVKLAPLKSHRMPFAPAFLCSMILLKIAESYRW